jgi:uncharacterized protein
MTQTPWRANSTGIVLSCRLTPKGGRNAIERTAILADGAGVLMARVRAAAEDGRANRALCELLAAALDVATSQVAIIAGAKSRIKRIAATGDPKALIEQLTAL